MNIVGIIAEYNPFHNGHLYHLQQAKILTQSNYTVVIMSPNFVQRGYPALTDKWTRTKMALLGGADLVIELPTPYATASAEYFASSSISLLHHTGIVSHLNFGSESNDLTLLNKVASLLKQEPYEFKILLKKYLNLGLSFPLARAKALTKYSGSLEIRDMIQSPNNILGVEYLKALARLGSPIIPTSLQRKSADYHNTKLTSPLSSATAIRRQISQGHWDGAAGSVPVTTYNLLHDQDTSLGKLVDYNDLSAYLSYRLLFSTSSQLKGIMGMTEGLENRILKVFQTTQNIEEMLLLIKSKRFTQTAIQRILLNIILQVTKDDFNEFQTHGGPQYIRVLGFKKSSAHLLSQLKSKASLPLIMNVPKDYDKLPALAKRMFDLEVRSSNIYASLQSSGNNQNLDYTNPLVII